MTVFRVLPLLFGLVIPVAAMASPPYHDGTGQKDNTASTFGKVEGTTVETETAIGFSTGFSVGYEADFGIFGGAEFSVTVEQSLDFTSTRSKTIEKYHSYTSGPAEDKVVFSSVPFDVYYYTAEEHQLQKAVSLAESAYDELSRVFDYQIQEPTPLISDPLGLPAEQHHRLRRARGGPGLRHADPLPHGAARRPARTSAQNRRSPYATAAAPRTVGR